MIRPRSGGYTNLASHEAEPVAHWLTGLGVAAFLLRYHVAPHARHPAMLADAQRAVRTVRRYKQVIHTSLQVWM